MIGDLDAVVAEAFRSLRPISDLRGVTAYVTRREEGAQQHDDSWVRGVLSNHCSQNGLNLANIGRGKWKGRS
jgi:hypothetical protein